MNRKRVFVYVQHLLGIGHLRRAVTLARAMARAELEVTLASGGFVVPGLAPENVRWVQLPPAGARDERFSELVDAQGRPVDDAWRARRRDALLAAWREADPHLLLLELFPFGRRQMRFELLPWLDQAIACARRPVIVSSVRDILGGGQRDPSRQDEMLATFRQYFDHVLVHGDPRWLRFDRTFRHAAALGERLHYTGYVVHLDAVANSDGGIGSGEVIVSAGGGAVGATLLETAIRCRSLTALAQATWRVLAGTNITPEALERLQALACDAGHGHVIVERSREDFRCLLRNCALSISQAGYNTLVEILESGASAVVVPFAGGNETEQTLRARMLADDGRVDCVEEFRLTPEALAAAVNRAASRPRLPRAGIDLDGANRSAQWIAGWANGVAW
jgi:predicted glycosyltransferase